MLTSILMAAAVQFALPTGCSTNVCREAMALVQAVPSNPNRTPANVQLCVEQNRQLGQYINEVAAQVTMRYDAGEIGYDEASEIRNLFHTESYALREALRDTLPTGDVQRCTQIRRIGVRLIRTIDNQTK